MSGFAAFREATLAALHAEHDAEASAVIASGAHVTNLTLASRRVGFAGKTLLSFTCPRAVPHVDAGTPVRLCVANSQRPEDAIKGIVASSEPVLLVETTAPLSVDGAQPLWILDQLPDETTVKRISTALKSIDPETNAWARVLFPRSAPTSSSLSSTPPPEPVASLYNNALNAAQRRAVAMALAPTTDLLAIHGPPGTGKSSVLVEIVRQLVALGRRVLVCAPSNVAVDNVLLRLALYKLDCVRLGHPSRIDARAQPWSMDGILAASDAAALVADARRELQAALDKRQWAVARELRAEIKSRERTAVHEAVARAHVVLATVTTCGKLAKLAPRDRRYTLVVDEAAQTSLASAFIPLALGCVDVCILAGDHMQLAPTVKLAAAEALLGRSLMQAAVAARPAATALLDVQYRMHPCIMRWASAASYEGRLVAATGEDVISTVDDVLGPVVFIDTAGCGMDEEAAAQSWANQGEAALACAHVKRLLEAGVLPSECAVIAPYSAQVALIRDGLAAAGVAGVQVKTVDGFQGQERRAVVLSLVRSGKGVVGFLADRRRINVAVTRAQQHFALIGDSATLSRDAFLKGLVDYCSEHGEVRSADEFAAGAAVASAVSSSLSSSTAVASSASSSGAVARARGKKARQKRGAPVVLSAANAQAAVARKPVATVAAAQERPRFADLAIESDSSSSPPSPPSSPPPSSPPPSSPAAVVATAASPTPKPTKPAAVDDELAFLSAAAIAAKQCAHAHCREATAVYGFDCKHCRQRFCTHHRIPETHGCTPPKTAPRKPALQPSARQQLVRKVEAKIAGEQKKRSANKA